MKLAHGDVAARVTSRHLLTHTAGWVGDYFSDTGRGDDALSRYVAELRSARASPQPADARLAPKKPVQA